MGWIQLPRIDEPGNLLRCLMIAEGSNGFFGGLVTTEASIGNPDWKQSLAMDSGEIQAVGDDGKKRRSVLRVSGNLREFFPSGYRRWIALNERVTGPELLESTHILGFDGKQWLELAALDYIAVHIWPSGGPVLLANGRPVKDQNHFVNLVTRDGGMQWVPVDLHGMDPLANELRGKYCLNEAGKIFALSGQNISTLDLADPAATAGWKSLADVPAQLKPRRLYVDSQRVIVFGSTLEGQTAVWEKSFAGNDSLRMSQGIQKEFEIEQVFIQGVLWRVAGSLEIQKNGETQYYQQQVWESKDNGAHWLNLGLPIKGSLESISFGSDGRIWALAAGNRMQVYLPK